MIQVVYYSLTVTTNSQKVMWIMCFIPTCGVSTCSSLTIVILWLISLHHCYSGHGPAYRPWNWGYKSGGSYLSDTTHATNASFMLEHTKSIFKLVNGIEQDESILIALAMNILFYSSRFIFSLLFCLLGKCSTKNLPMID